MNSAHCGQASVTHASAWRIREELYSEFMPETAAEKMKNPLKKLGQPLRWLRTAARMKIECSPDLRLLSV